MLPDDYENLAESVVATNFFANNILQCITTKNYWDVVNEYKPLMHTWYVGVIMQFYVSVPLLLFAIGKWAKKNMVHVSIITITAIGSFSLAMYLFAGTTPQKFYYLPFRLYEFCAGALVSYIPINNDCKEKRLKKILLVIIYIILLTLLFVGFDILLPQVRLLLTVTATTLLLYLLPRVKLSRGPVFSNKWIAILGTGSYSIYVWHQIIFAFTRYSFTSQLTGWTLVLIVIFIGLLSYLSYRYIEHLQKSKTIWIIQIMLWLVVCGFSMKIYLDAGVVRDVPELDIVKGKAIRGQWASYNDEGFKFDKDFSTTSSKPKWYVIGNSFGRDWVNIIKESSIKDSVEISYSTETDCKKHIGRFVNADAVFLSTLGVNENLIDSIHSLCSAECCFYIVGEKNFGVTNGQIYRHRKEKNYHQLTTIMESKYSQKNDMLKAKYKDIFIDMIAPVQQNDGSVRVFSDDGHFISQDCRHLTKSGAEYYGRLIDLKQFLNCK